jgi:hypothetical protein
MSWRHCAAASAHCRGRQKREWEREREREGERGREGEREREGDRERGMQLA